MKEFTAKTTEMCEACGFVIEIGKPITWTRNAPVKYYHPECLGKPARKPIDLSAEATKADITKVAPVPAPLSLGFSAAAPVATAPDDLMGLMKKMLDEVTALKAPLTIVVPVEDKALPATAVSRAATAPKPSAVTSWKPHEWWVAAEALSKVVSRILLVGHPGVGKSWLFDHFNSEWLYSVTCHEDITESYLQGTWRVNPTEGMQWSDGVGVKAMREGVPLVLHEIERASAEVKSLLYAFMDLPAKVTLPTGETVRAKPGYCVLATSNEMPDSLPPALCDRIDAVVKAAEPRPEISAAWTDEGIKQVTLAWYKKTPLQTYKPDPTSRHAEAFTALVKAGIDRECAGLAVYVDAWPEICSMMANAKAVAKAGGE